MITFHNTGIPYHLSIPHHIPHAILSRILYQVISIGFSSHYIIAISKQVSRLSRDPDRIGQQILFTPAVQTTLLQLIWTIADPVRYVILPWGNIDYGFALRVTITKW